MRIRHATAAVSALVLLMSVPGAAFAAEGTTSGPAAGNNATPSTAVQKKKDATGNSTGQGGGPGVEGQPGNKSGPAATPNSGNSNGNSGESNGSSSDH